VGVLSRVLEEGGLTTTGITLLREHTEQVKPPRALWVPFAYGRPLGVANDPALQHRVIAAALALVDATDGPVLREFPEDDPAAPEDLSLPQASDVQPVGAGPTDVAFEVTRLRPYYEQWVAAHGGRTAVGLSGLDQRRFRGAIRFLEAYARGEDADMTERPPDVLWELFARRVVDDLKAFYLEAHQAQRPNDGFQAHYRWFWGETGLAVLLRQVAERLRGAHEPRLDQLAFGIVR